MGRDSRDLIILGRVTIPLMHLRDHALTASANNSYRPGSCAQDSLTSVYHASVSSHLFPSVFIPSVRCIPPNGWLVLAAIWCTFQEELDSLIQAPLREFLVFRYAVLGSLYPYSSQLNLLRCFLAPIAYGIFLAVAQLFLNKPNNVSIHVRIVWNE